MSTPDASTDALWTPSPARAARTRLAGFREAAGFDGYPSLHRWSVEDQPAFWALAWDRLGVIGDRGERIVVGADGPMTAARFFPDARLNVAENILRTDLPVGDVMFVSTDELGRRREWRRGEVAETVGRLAAALRVDGVVAGDRVAAWMPNVVETVMVMLAAASIGAVFSSTSPDFGVDGVVDRFGQIEPVVLVAADGYHYGGKRIDCLERLARIRASLPTVRRVVVTDHLEGGAGRWPADLDDVVRWDDYLEPHRGADASFEPLPFDHPWYVLYSSGTTGVPKCIVHRAGGVLIQHLKEHQLHCDIGGGDRVLYYSTCGWMMWNWLASVPASGATALLYDGSPFHPGPAALLELAAAESLTFFGVSAKYLDSLRASAIEPAREAPIPTVRTIASTGSPLAPETFEWVYRSVSPDVHLASISGGTDLCACFVAGDPTAAVHAGEIQRPALGMAVDVWDDSGATTSPGERGELVCTRAFPSMPLGFWGDDDGSRYRGAYFERFDGVWAQGDFASRTAHGGFVLHGRSDTTLNPGGVRIGTAEIYRRVEQVPGVVESLVFGQDWDGDSRIVLLVRLADGVDLTEALAADIRARIRTGCTPRHVPAVIAVVDDLPRTRSGKLAELAVSDVVNGRVVRNTTALANPEVLEVIAGLDELQH